MNIRIDGQTQPPDAEAARRLESPNPADRPSATNSARTATGSDRVEVSTDAQLVAAAIRAAEDAPAIRPEAVERGRRALESGTLGDDPGRLADRIIDALLSSSGPLPRGGGPASED
jgi:flagellar biosynthesis anti-sigma factor FlgM